MAPTGLHPPSNRGEARYAANEAERESERDDSKLDCAADPT